MAERVRPLKEFILTNGWAPHSTVHVYAVVATFTHDVVHIEDCIHHWLRVLPISVRMSALSTSWDQLFRLSHSKPEDVLV